MGTAWTSAEEELDRIDTKLIEKYWKDTRDTLETEE